MPVKIGRPPLTRIPKRNRVSVSDANQEYLAKVGQGFPSVGLTRVIAFHKRYSNYEDREEVLRKLDQKEVNEVQSATGVTK